MRAPPARTVSRLRTALLALIVLLAGCQGRYFDDIAPPPATAPKLIEQLPSEYWTGIVFNGEKIGFTHLALRREGDGWRIESRAALKFRLLGLQRGSCRQRCDAEVEAAAACRTGCDLGELLPLHVDREAAIAAAAAEPAIRTMLGAGAAAMKRALDAR